MIRAVILAATAATLICLWLDRPTPVQAVEVKYCPVNFLAAFKMPDGSWRKVWAESWGLCKDMDRFEFI